MCNLEQGLEHHEKVSEIAGRLRGREGGREKGVRSGREGERERRKERRGGEGERVGKRWQLLCSQLLPKYLLQTAACVCM